MSMNEPATPAVTKDALPVCPYCAQDPAILSWRQIQLGQFQALMIFCGNPECRSLFAVEAIGLAQPGAAAPQSRIISPS